MLWLLCAYVASTRQVERPRRHIDTRRQVQQYVWELEQRHSPACWSRFDYDRVSAARSGNVRDVTNAARTRSAVTEASSTHDGAAAEDAAQAVLHLYRDGNIAVDAFLRRVGQTVRLT